MNNIENMPKQKDSQQNGSKLSEIAGNPSDIVDKKSEYQKGVYARLLRTVTFLTSDIAGILPQDQDQRLLHDYLVFYVYSLVSILAGGAIGFRANRRLEKVKRENIYDNKELGVRTERIIYQGEEKNVAGKKLKKGDKILTVGFPHIDSDSSQKERKTELQDTLYNLCIHDIEEHISPDSYDYILIKADERENLKLTSSATITLESLMEGRDLLLTKYERAKKYLLLDKHELKDSNKSADIEQINLIAQYLQEDEKLSSERILSMLNSLMHDSLSQEDFDTKKEQLKEALVKYLSNGVSNMYGRSERQRQPKTGSIKRENIHVSVIHSSDKAESENDPALFVIENSSIGNEIRALDEYIGLKLRGRGGVFEEKSLQDLDSQDPIYPLQIAYLLLKDIYKLQFKDLQFNEMSGKDFLDFLKKERIKLTSKNESIIPVLDKKHTGKKLLAEAAINIGLWTAIISGVAHDQIAPIVAKVTDALSSLNSSNSLSNSETNGVGFFNELPDTSPVWKVEANGNISPAGYYIQDTSYQLDGDTWVAVKDVEFENITLPKQVVSDYINITGIFELNSFGDSRMKLLVKNNTDVNNITIFDNSGNQITNFRVNRLVDGTYELIIPQPSLLATSVTITEQLVPTNTIGVRATGKVSGVDINQIDEDIRNQMNYFVQYAQDYHIPVWLIIKNYISDHYDYSVHPPDADALNNANTDTEKLNTIWHLSAMLCNVANTEEILLASVYDQQNTVNAAWGYVFGNNSYSSGRSSQFLTVDGGHFFGVTDTGDIVDATPIKAANDPMTKQYLSDGNGTTRTDQFWEDHIHEVDNKAQLDRDLILFVEAIGGAIAATGILAGGKAGTRKVIKRLKEYAPQKIEELMNGLIPDEEADAMESFLGSISWANEGEYYAPVTTDPFVQERNGNRLGDLRRMVSYDAMIRYITNIGEFKALEQSALNAGLTREQIRKFRLIAALYVLRMKDKSISTFAIAYKALLNGLRR